MPYIDVLGKKTYFQQSGNFQAGLKTILCVHGAGGTSENWIYQLANFDNCNIIAPDLPGHGLSEGSPPDSINSYRDFVLNFAQALEINSFVLMGHSMGGAIALELAIAHPIVLKGLIIVGSGARLRVNPSVLDALSRGRCPVENIEYSYSKKSPPAILDKARLAMNNVPIDVLKADFYACNKFDIMNRLPRIKIPVLIICGKEDQMTPLKYSDYLCKNIPNSNLVHVTNAGHMAMLERPDQVNGAITKFLEMLY
ncbi:alpha/beta fold hydrolase [Desulfosporosinus hippei]|uniref:Pimeloyl-ACP methyl ester carboxylesterase n=1 Tax=Desulfosporosinus hippei DSM 8344 TaxID=1121419 RepID=A0A1G8A949_9FIRM|nr:alpha/beta hydrolase [Desulfosporosinus hippei]SDH17397.1 Pimeloyl-ACP methyl ester carboxylesterase [Desulfosporosinus hippei DSM 8344]